MSKIPAVSSDADEQASLPVTRFEMTVALALTLVGAAVRFAFPSAMAIEHFDEGVYASNLLFPDQDYRYPDRHLYAPSLVPALIEWSIILFGDKGIAPMLPSLLFGTLTIPLIWWVGRQWFGPIPGLAAATLSALAQLLACQYPDERGVPMRLGVDEIVYDVDFAGQRFGLAGDEQPRRLTFAQF